MLLSLNIQTKDEKQKIFFSCVADLELKYREMVRYTQSDRKICNKPSNLTLVSSVPAKWSSKKNVFPHQFL